MRCRTGNVDDSSSMVLGWLLYFGLPSLFVTAVGTVVVMRVTRATAKRENEAMLAGPPRRPAGWYADPAAEHELRYHDGSKWTAHVSDGGTVDTEVVDMVDLGPLPPERPQPGD